MIVTFPILPFSTAAVKPAACPATDAMSKKILGNEKKLLTKTPPLHII